MTVSLIAAAEGASGGAPPFLNEVGVLLIAAAVAAYLANRFRQVPIVGFLAAGVLIGPNALGLVRSLDTVNAAAELGVILLLFTIGIEFSIDRLTAIRRLIVGGGTLQVGLATLVVTALSLAVGAGAADAVYTGMLVALSSTAIVLKLLGDREGADSRAGRAQLGLLIFQDLAIVAFVLLVPMLAGTGGGPVEIALALGRAVLVVAAVLFGARRLMPRILENVARGCSQEVFLLVVVAICIGAAWATGTVIGSVTLGAFLAGLLVGDSAFDLQALGEIIPLQALFSAVFFLSIGMLLEPRFLVANPLLVLAVIAVVMVVKLVTTGVAVRLIGEPAGIATVTAFGLAQIGEFSFVLERVGRDAGLTPAGLGEAGSQTFIAATVLLMAATPLVTGVGRRLADRRRRDPEWLDEELADATGDDSGHVVVAGYGTGASALAEILDRTGIPFVVTTLSPDGARDAEERGWRVLRGDATRPATLEAARLADARCLVVPDDIPGMVARITAAARRVGPGVPIIARVDGDPEADEVGVDELVTADRASSLAVNVHVLRHFGLADAAIAAEVGFAGKGALPRGFVTASLSRVDHHQRVDFRPDNPEACRHLVDIRPVTPGAPGCEECLRMGARWNHLRICLHCGHTGCCDSSPNRHAAAHHRETGHPVVASAEEGEDWAWCYTDRVRIDGSAASAARADT